MATTNNVHRHSKARVSGAAKPSGIQRPTPVRQHENRKSPLAGQGWEEIVLQGSGNVKQNSLELREVPALLFSERNFERQSKQFDATKLPEPVNTDQFRYPFYTRMDKNYPRGKQLVMSCDNPCEYDSSSAESSPQRETFSPVDFVAMRGDDSWSRKPYNDRDSKQATMPASTVLIEPSVFHSQALPETPLEAMRWPFDETFGLIETRLGGGGGSQPSTTGSQGFPQFVTAGPGSSLLGHNLFGYDREEMMGSFSWA